MLTTAGLLSSTLSGCSGGSPLDLLLKPAVVTKIERVEPPKSKATAATCKPRPDEPSGPRIRRADLYDWIARLIAWGDSCAAAVEEMKAPPPAI